MSEDIAETVEEGAPRITLKPEPRPGTLRILQTDFINYLISEFGIKKSACLDRIRKMSSEGLLFADPSEARRTAILLSLRRLYEKWCEEDGDMTPLGLLTDSEVDCERMKLAGIVGKDEYAKWFFTETALDA